jgi:hypothetical protein
MGEKEQPWFVGQRAFALASVLLSERKELAVWGQPGPDSGIDILAEITDGDRRTGRLFGVEVIGRLPANGHPLEDGAWTSERAEKIRTLMMPVCVFLIDVRANTGLFAWVLEPHENDQAPPKLVFQATPRWGNLDSAAIDQIVGRTNGWYSMMEAAIKA